MQAKVLQLELDQKAAGHVLASLAERLLKLERLRDDAVDEDTFADAKNVALALGPLYVHIRQQAIQKFGKSILGFAESIAELDSLYSL